MNIVFICGSFEAGRDGVGDYTRKLAEALISKGHNVGIIALNDQYITEVFEGIPQSGDLNIRIIRLPSIWPSKKRWHRAGLWVDEINPEWISIQFVPFAFHSKGLSFGLGKSLAKIGHGRRWHIMVHELWVGMNEEASLKFVLWGSLQKRLIRNLFKTLKPSLIHTQSILYEKEIQKIGLRATLLPLFGNIPMRPVAPKKIDNESKNISFVLFGGIHPEAPVKELINELKLYSVSNGIGIEIITIGRCGKEQFIWEKECDRADLPIKVLGEQSPATISEVLSNSCFGISTTPASLIEKSGAVAAMREHGLNILCVSCTWTPRNAKGIRLPNGVMQYEQGQIEKFIKYNFKSFSYNNITDITNQFVSNLSLCD